jgi:hypothetical protein
MTIETASKKIRNVGVADELANELEDYYLYI